MIVMIEIEIIVTKIDMNVIKKGIIGTEIEMNVIIVIEIDLEMIDIVEKETTVVNQNVGKIKVREVKNYGVIMIVTVSIAHEVTVVVCAAESRIGRKKLLGLTVGMMIMILH